MSRTSFRRGLATGLAALALSSSAAVSPAAATALPGDALDGRARAVIVSETRSEAGDRGSVTFSCPSPAGSFSAVGDAEVTWAVVNGVTSVSVQRYRITASNGEGDRANIDLAVRNASTMTWTKSPDAMRQDGAWHQLGLTNGLPGVHTAIVLFTFDSPGHDPGCEATITL